MGTQPPIPVPWPTSSFPGDRPQESAGRLINCTAAPLGDPGEQHKGAPKDGMIWHRQPGLTQHATTDLTGYRGGLSVQNLSYEIWSGTVVTVDSGGIVALIGGFPGFRKVSIARNQKAPDPDVVAVDLDNGAWVLSGGVPVAYTGGGNLPQPKSVCFQDGYFFFFLGDLRCFASGINALTQNALTFTTAQAKSSVIGQRCIAFSGLLLLFTTASCEVWQDTANPFPGFPYSRLVVLEFGLVQENAIAGFEDGFSELLWVAQDFGVYRMSPGSLAPVKVSPPDLDRLIETQVRGGDTLEASCYIFSGKKFWVLSSSAWTWEFNLSTLKWNERVSLISGQLIRWRASGGHPAFGKWLMGDTQSGELFFIDDTNFTENGNPQLMRMESGVVTTFPNRQRVPRYDAEFVTGVGQAASLVPTVVDPHVAISWSDNNGLVWKNPIVRSLGKQGTTKTTRISVKNTGQTGPDGRRWRHDVTDAVYTAFFGSTMSMDPRNY